MKKQWLMLGVGTIAVALIIGGLRYERASAPAFEPSILQESSPTSSTTHPVSTTSAPVVQKSSSIPKFPINPADTIVSWNFKGPYTGNDALIAKASADIERLEELIGSGKYDDYDLYIGIGNANDLMGQGDVAYQNYNRAASIHPEKGLAYANLGHLMDELGAYHTAADAYAKAAAVEPITQYKTAQMDYLTWRFPEEAARLKTNQ